jgi:hypothetical protein
VQTGEVNQGGLIWRAMDSQPHLLRLGVLQPILQANPRFHTSFCNSR